MEQKWQKVLQKALDLQAVGEASSNGSRSTGQKKVLGIAVDLQAVGEAGVLHGWTSVTESYITSVILRPQTTA